MICMIKRLPFALIAVFIWIGFICSISFMEAWLKFRPELVTLPIGLSIGRLVFAALNKVEWFLAAVVTVHIILHKKTMRLNHLILFMIPMTILIIQTFLILPALYARVETILLGGEPSPSFIHLYYITMEVIKVVCLFAFGIILINKSDNLDIPE